MIDIKFRAWVRFMQKMARVDELFLNSGSALVNEYPYAIESDSFDLMQYTGLKDKNGVEIYEGDVVEITTIDNFTHHPISISKEVVSFNVANARFDNATHFCGVSVIGNIHENPELVGAQ